MTLTVQHIQSKKEANDWALATIGKIQALVRGNEKMFYGFDAANNIDETHEMTQTIQVCFPEEISQWIVVLDLTVMQKTMA
jgi:hypothetical protein